MAIVPGIPGLSVSIGLVSEDKPLEEFEHPNPEHPSRRRPRRSKFHLPESHGKDEPLPYVNKYIQSHPGKEFEFILTVDPSFQPLGPKIGFRSTIDGEVIGGFASDSNEKTLERKWEGRCCFNVIGNNTAGYKTQRFSFAPLRIVPAGEDYVSGLKKQRPIAHLCGKLVVMCYFIQNTIPLDSPLSYPAAIGCSELSEEAMKGREIDSRTAFKLEPRSRDAIPIHVDWHHSDTQNRPFAIFEFYYLSKQGLINQGVIPRPSAVEEVASMTEQEVRARLTNIVEDNELAQQISRRLDIKPTE
ncbi:hypothetical protein B0J18DRAFT_414692 [Chaetomium sp. MPI-SDFR-AT-0129]|nr:hypothetical protein B0J18DRAFT_414692 [Chaetomium sp. MPI-SDFR-AT-0129]